MTAPFFSATPDGKQFFNLGLSSTIYTLGMKCFFSAAVVGPSAIFIATTRDAESSFARPLILRQTTNVYRIIQNFPSAAQWDFSATDGQWNDIFIVHDRNSTACPVVYVNRVVAPVTIFSAGAGAVMMPSATAGWTIGARPGRPSAAICNLQHFVWANALWTQAQCNQFASAPGSFMQNVEFYYPFARPDMNADYGGKSSHLTAVNNTSGATPRDSTSSGGLRRMKLLRVGL